MTPVTHTQGQTVAVVGLGGSGLATARALVVVALMSSRGMIRKRKRQHAQAEGISVATSAICHGRRSRSLVLAPGIPLTHKDGAPFTHPAVAAAQAHSVEVIGDIELFCRERAAIAPDAPFIRLPHQWKIDNDSADCPYAARLRT